MHGKYEERIKLWVQRFCEAPPSEELLWMARQARQEIGGIMKIGYKTSDIPANHEKWRKRTKGIGQKDLVWWTLTELQEALKVWRIYCKGAANPIEKNNYVAIRPESVREQIEDEGLDELVHLMEGSVMKLANRMKAKFFIGDAHMVEAKKVHITEEYCAEIGRNLGAYTLIPKSAEHLTTLFYSPITDWVIITLGTSHILRETPWEVFNRDTTPLVNILSLLWRNVVWILPPTKVTSVRKDYEKGFKKLIKDARQTESTFRMIIVPNHQDWTNCQGFLTASGATAVTRLVEEMMSNNWQPPADDTPGTSDRPSLESRLQNIFHIRTTSAGPSSEVPPSPLGPEVTEEYPQYYGNLITNYWREYGENDFSADLDLVANAWLLSEEKREEKKKLARKIEGIISERWGRARVHLYGSSAAELDLKDSDLDITVLPERAIHGEITTETKRRELSSIQRTLWASHRQEAWFNHCFRIFSRNVQIIRIMTEELEIDISYAGNKVIESARWQKQNIKEQRLATLSTILKIWSKGKGLNDATHHFLNSYAWNIMVAHFHNRTRQLKKDTAWKLLGFFDYFARFPYQGMVITAEGMERRTPEDGTNPIFVRDPTDANNNVTRNVTSETLRKTTTTMGRQLDRFIWPAARPSLDLLGIASPPGPQNRGKKRLYWTLLLLILLISKFRWTVGQSAMMCNEVAPARVIDLQHRGMSCAEWLPGTKVKIRLQVYRVNMEAREVRASRCVIVKQKVEYWENLIGEGRNVTTSETLPISKEECLRMTETNHCQYGPLSATEGIKRTLNDFNPTIDYSYFSTQYSQRTNCFQTDEKLYFDPSTETLHSPIDNMAKCALEDEECPTEGGSLIVWKKPTDEVRCKYTYLATWHGDYYPTEKIWTKEDLALSFTSDPLTKEDCGHEYVMSDQGYLIKQEVFDRITRIRSKRATVKTEQLASQLTAAQLNSITKLKTTVCWLLNTGLHRLPFTSMDATTIARNIFQQDLIEARWITNSERNLLEVKKCIRIEKKHVYFLPNKEKNCFEFIPVNISIYNNYFKAYVDPVSLIIREESKNGSCKKYRSQTIFWEGELLTIDQLEGHVVNHPQAETITLDQLNGSSLPTLDTLIFKNLELTNDSDPTIKLLASFRTFARGQHMQAIVNDKSTTENYENPQFSYTFSLTQWMSWEIAFKLTVVYNLLSILYLYILPWGIKKILQRTNLIEATHNDEATRRHSLIRLHERKEETPLGTTSTPDTLSRYELNRISTRVMRKLKDKDQTKVQFLKE